MVDDKEKWRLERLKRHWDIFHAELDPPLIPVSDDSEAYIFLIEEQHDQDHKMHEGQVPPHTHTPLGVVVYEPESRRK